MSLIEHWIALRPERTTTFAHSPAAYMTSADEAEKFRAKGWEVIGPLTDDRGAVEALRELYEAGLDLADLIGSDDGFRRWELAMDAARPAVRGQS